MPKKRVRKCTRWPLGLLMGDRVRVRGRYARVAEAYLKDVPKGHVPVKYEDRRGNYDFVCVIADDIDLC